MRRAGHLLTLSFALTGIFAPGPAPALGSPRPMAYRPALRINAGPIEARLKLPAGLRAGQSVPVLLIFGGFESAGHVLDLVHPSVPVALASFDYPFSAPRKLRFPGSLRALPEARRVFPETLRGIFSLVRALKDRPEVDPDRIIVVGASFGSPFAVAAAAEDPEISGLVIIHGFGRVPETAEKVILRSWLPRYGRAARPVAWLLSRSIWLYLGIPSPEDFARRLRSGQRVLMVTALEDSFVPRESSDALWNAIRESHARSTRILMPTDHLMPGSDGLIGEIIGKVETWIRDDFTRPDPHSGPAR